MIFLAIFWLIACWILGPFFGVGIISSTIYYFFGWVLGIIWWLIFLPKDEDYEDYEDYED